MRSTAVVVHTRFCGVVGKAVVLEVDLSSTLRQNADHGIERAESIGVLRAALVRVRNRDHSVVDEEANLLSRAARTASHDLSCEVGGERHDLASDEGVEAFIADGVVQSRTIEQSSKVEGGEGIKDNDLVGGISVDGLVEREVGRGVVEGLVQGGVGWWVGVVEASEPLLKEALALSSADWATWAVVVVEGLTQC